VAAIVGFVPGMLDPFAGPKATALAVLGLASLAAFAVAAARRRPAFTALDIAVAAWCGVAVLSALFSVSPRLSWLGESGQREGLRTTLAFAGLYVAARAAHRVPSDERRTLDAALLAAVAAAAYAMIQCSGYDPLAWSNVATYPAGGHLVLRPASTLGNATALGAMLAAALAIVTARLAAGRGARATLVPAAALLGVALLTTLSRGALLGAGVGLVVALAGAWVSGRDGAAGRAARAALALAAPALPAIAWGLLVLRGPLAARAAEGAGGESSPARLEIARSALALWRAHPWLGVGPDGFALAFPRVQTAAFWGRAWLGLPAHAHSVPLQVLATGGALAALAGLAWLACALGGLAREARAGGERAALALESGAALAALAVCGVFNVPGLAGAAWYVGLTSQSSPSGASADTRVPRGAWAAAALAALAVLASATGPWGAQFDAARANTALMAMASEPPETRLALARLANEAAGRAATRSPGDETLWRIACDADLAQADAALRLQAADEAHAAGVAAERDARRALALVPARAIDHQRLANALALTADTADADAEYATALRLAPSDGDVLVDQARAQLVAGRFAAASATASRLAALYPDAAWGHALGAAALAALGRNDKALQAATRALASRWDDGSEAQRAATLALSRALAVRGS
jgi:O-antigen ligase